MDGLDSETEVMISAMVNNLDLNIRS